MKDLFITLYLRSRFVIVMAPPITSQLLKAECGNNDGVKQ